MHGFGSDWVWIGRWSVVRRKRHRPGAAIWPLATAMLMVPRSGWAQVATTLNGPPVQVTPYVQEPGVPLITIIPGTPSPPSSGAGDGSGTGVGPGGGGDDGGGSESGSDPLNTMLSTSWGITAVGNAEAVGINPSALAATCVLESGCQNLGSNSLSSAVGAFQMTPATYTASLNAALAVNPSLVANIAPGASGMLDPATESIAASEYLLQGAQAIQSQGVTNPTVLDVRGYYNFGPSGAALAIAGDDETMAAVMPNVSASVFAANGVTPGETVGQWKAGIAAKIGNAAGESVFNG